MPNIVMYCTETCPFCMRAENLLVKKGVQYNKILIDNNESLFQEMITKAGRDSVPQIFIDDKHIGGFDDLVELDIDDELDPLLGIA
ncbi:Glutaredoxin 3 [hydrothermal vent metagenome]|uniref:Glutaredoxin 3 n=1 Tax=hydrothermal vent metagenome TaxID=652676 RepID=A0A3B0ZQ84_9ZZZZ